MHRCLGLFVLLVTVAACASQRRLPTTALLPIAALDSPQHFLVVTVRNPVEMPSSEAASTPRAYDGMGAYTAGRVARSTGSALAREYHLEEVSNWPIGLLGVHCLVYAMPQGADGPRIVQQLASDRRVESVQSLQRFDTQTAAYNDPYAKLQNNIARMQVTEAHALSRGSNVRIAVIDTGVAFDHPDLPTNLQTRNLVDNNTDAFLSDPHGTAVAGVIAAVTDNGIGIVGIAPDARLLLLKACWRTGAVGTPSQCNSFTLAQAIAAAVEARVDIINLSLAGPDDPLLRRLLARAIDAGIIVVGAVPVDGLRNAFPTNIDAVIAVDTAESGHAQTKVLYAPGRDVLSLAPQAHYDFYSGSSLATAEISGLIALLRADKPSLTAAEAQRLLFDSESGTVDESTSRVPRICQALAAMLKRSGCAAE